MGILGAVKDDICGYRQEEVNISELVGSSDRTLIPFLGGNQMVICNNEMVTRMKHFAVAFFGHQLQGRQELDITIPRNLLINREAWSGVLTKGSGSIKSKYLKRY